MLKFLKKLCHLLFGHLEDEEDFEGFSLNRPNQRENPLKPDTAPEAAPLSGFGRDEVKGR